MYGFQQPYAQPAYVAPPPMYGGYGRPPAGPTVIHINNDDKDQTPCLKCGTKTLSVT